MVDGASYRGQMPAFGDKLNAKQIADVLSYVRTAFNSYGEVGEDAVKKAMSNGKRPADMLPKVNQAVFPSPQSPAQSNGAAPKSVARQPYEGKTMDFTALHKALGKIEFDAPFPAQIETLSGEFAEMVKLGYLIFTDTQRYAKKYVGNGLDCRNCHTDAGARPDAAPLWAAIGNFPAYRGKNNLVNTFENRLQGCFTYSMNGIAPPSGGQVLTALSAYAYWLGRGVPLGMDLEGRGYPKVEAAQDADKDNGGKLYAAKCAICHGNDGQGTRTRDGHGYQFPPLWGPDSYNWGAGMHKNENFAGFIKGNMPLGQGGTLTDQEALDIAAWVNQQSHSRPTAAHNPGQAPNF